MTGQSKQLPRGGYRVSCPPLGQATSDKSHLAGRVDLCTSKYLWTDAHQGRMSRAHRAQRRRAGCLAVVLRFSSNRRRTETQFQPP